ncbi:DNA translocase FtsK [Telmatobacter bradus]|uniref:DNA translocase FtsK n=1 Tax=Telmatobacter bradus TaxID=474953 RepID=UPI003B43341B
MKPLRIVLAPTRSRPVNVFLGLVLLLAATLLLLALATYHATDPSLNTAAATSDPHAVRNWIGLLGAYSSDLLLQTFGVTAFLMPLWLASLGWTWARSRPGGPALLRWMGTLLALIFLPAVLGLAPWRWLWLHMVPMEGVVGRLSATLLVQYLNIQGAWIVAGLFAALGLYFASAVGLQAILEAFGDRWPDGMSLRDRWQNWREERAEQKQLQEDLWANYRPDTDSEDAEDGPLTATEKFPKPPSRLAMLFGRRRAPQADPLDEIPAYQRARLNADDEKEKDRRKSIWERSSGQPIAAKNTVPSEAEAEEKPGSAYDQIDAAYRQNEAERTATPTPEPPAQSDNEDLVPVAARPIAAPWSEEDDVAPLAAPVAASRPISGPAPVPPTPMLAKSDDIQDDIQIHERADLETRKIAVAPKTISGFKLPPSTLLYEGEGPQSIREEALREEAKTLEDKCAEFDVRGRVVQINPGPMVTTYEFKPEAGVKYSRVTGLSDDLCLAMRAESILIERMAGKSTVGIQVPNHERETIHLRSIIESETFAKAKSLLTLSMGKDINGRIVTADLASMPHVLIAGSTGSGKSVAINAMIMSLLFRTTPQQVRLILVDPKRVELGMYEGVPHLFTPIITEPKLAANALRNAVREMERRLKLLASRSVRNIDQYNKLYEGSAMSLFEGDEQDEGPLPFIVIIIDELADLMMLDRANVEESITRLAQMARAVGIHLVLATQRPSVDVITGLIKANVPTRISFRLATKVDSRTILDTNGAESLLGRGDMLFLPPGTSRLVRLHAPYVSEKETASVVGFWKAQGEADYMEGFLESPKDEHGNPEGTSTNEDDNDPLFDDAVRLVFEFGKASTSLLQRRLRVGYGRAAHLVDMMERDGLVGPADGSRPRELLKSPGWLHEVPANNE